ncbi:hypothetical protein RJT34_07947 [Clitoria ternatea]|uniref:Uncharacterized protein n=1 Tax=Clitoria ternatea TaxID=43366 RepID=A0AAN9PU95_CLITE
MNIVVLMKLAWTNKRNQSEIWVQVLAGKYGRTHHNDVELAVESSDSGVWRSIASVWSQISQHEGWSIGTGDETLFWKHNWVNSSLILEEVALNLPAEIQNCIVKEMTSDEGAWDWHKFEEFLPEAYVQMIYNIMPPHTDLGKDEVV